VSLVVFFTIKLIPGDPIASLVGPRATPQIRQLVAQRYGLDKPLVAQYVTWVRHALTGDLGNSIAQQHAVTTIVGVAFQNTLMLTLFAAVIAVAAGVGLAMVTAFSHGRLARAVSSAVSLLAVSTPQYSLGIILIVVVAAGTGWLPAGGMQSATAAPTWGGLLQHLVLPGVTAAAIPMGIIARMFSTSLVEEAGQPYVESLRARGLPERRVRRHIFAGSQASLLTIAGLQIGYLLGGVVFVEVIFSWPGLGQAIYQSISRRDYPVIQAGVLIAALSFVVLNLVVDVLRAALDPRVRRSGVTA
jgi:peptide/nickel transport system permease protein